MLLNIKVVSWSLGIFLAISYLLCVLYGLIVPERLHGMKNGLESMLPAFKWLTPAGFILGLIESFLYGVYIGIVFVPIYLYTQKVRIQRRGIICMVREFLMPMVSGVLS